MNLDIQVDEIHFAGNGDTFLAAIDAALQERQMPDRHVFVSMEGSGGALWQGEALIYGGEQTTFLQTAQGGGENGVRVEAPASTDYASIAARLPVVSGQPGPAPDVEVQFVRARLTNGGEAKQTTWAFDVTLAHPDTGWSDYADGWHVETAEGEISGTRILLHPHEAEQPFTRSLSGVVVPTEVEEVFIRPHDLVSGYGERGTAIRLGKTGQGEGYEVER